MKPVARSFLALALLAPAALSMARPAPAGIVDGQAPGFDSGLIHRQGTWDHLFEEEGTYMYHCQPHPYMTARVVVVADANATSGNASVAIQDFKYAPADLRIRPGTRVEWTNQDAEAHTVTQDSPGHGAATKSAVRDLVFFSVLGLVAAVGVFLWVRGRRRA